MKVLYYDPWGIDGNIEPPLKSKWMEPQRYWTRVFSSDRLRGWNNPKIHDYDLIITLILRHHTHPEYSNHLPAEYLRKVLKYNGIICLIMEPHPPRWYKLGSHGTGQGTEVKGSVECADFTILDCSPYVDFYRKFYNTNKIFYCPNPYNVKALNEIMDLTKREENVIGTTSHCNYPQSLNRSRDVITALKQNFDKKMEVRYFFERTRIISDWKMMGWIPEMDKHLPRLNELKIFIDDCTGGASMMSGHCASMGVPVVGNNQTDRILHCFPDLVCEPQDVKCMAEKAKKLLTDSDFYNQQVKKGLENVEIYSFENCRKRLMGILRKNNGCDI